MSIKSILVVSPHPDDETLGCGGTILKFKNIGYAIYWLIVTEMKNDFGYSDVVITKREQEIIKVTEAYNFDRVIKFGIPTSNVDIYPKKDLVSKFSTAINELKPNIILTPFINDIHSDHQIISAAVLSCAKWFRYPFIESILYYETISETDFNIDSQKKTFSPNVYVDITEQIERKIDIMKIYESEIQNFPFPRSEKAVLSLASIRGAQCGVESAECFELLKTTIKF